LTIAADQYDRLLAHLERFIIMDDVELVPLSEETALGSPVRWPPICWRGLAFPLWPSRIYDQRAR
jgi:hypothetical protein